MVLQYAIFKPLGLYVWLILLVNDRDDVATVGRSFQTLVLCSVLSFKAYMILQWDYVSNKKAFQ